ncbi:glycosyltransferase N-terminal domain-containing protein [Aurantibacter sp.]|uniref:3-deoxy-D-manno-octulosonic acid transferase n=1 Tax=Aurantibacter sp. TaxID=2807103 RepID=UPI00326429D1
MDDKISGNDKIIWFHVSSLGEFEQGLPIIENIKTQYPFKKIVVTFFSPSGYEVKKNTKSADIVCYMPLDTIKNARKFLAKVNPELAIFIKYEIWPNFLNELQKRKIPSILVSAIFKKNQIYFKSYGSFMRKSLNTFDHIFVQDENSKTLLATINLNNTTVSGDTRFDRVAQILKRDNHNELIASFKQNQTCLVVGSSWPEDEKIIVAAINNSNRLLKWIIAPHNIKKDQIIKLKDAINKKVLLYSEGDLSSINSFEVLIIDNIGLLTQIYSYADLAYVGGGFATGLHNTLEPAVFGIPVIIGPNFDGFKEAEDMVALKGIHTISNYTEFDNLLSAFLDQNPQTLLKETGAINDAYLTKNKGASVQITAYIRTLL